ncbi:DUF547 domain-containing protein [Lujinxingia litoralis]|nr:DUF547 domain-containing protein [Lujinxingia litoralis]
MAARWSRASAPLRVAPLMLLALSSCAPRAALLDSPLVAELHAGQESGLASFDHRPLDALLKTHVNPETGTVDYHGLQQQEPVLDSYLHTIAAADAATLNQDEQLALLLNAYNAYTLKLILDHLPVDSIRDIDNPWTSSRYPVAGYTLSLDEIEHGLIRPLYQDPRIHFAVNCAARSCPHLAAEAFTGADLNAQLDARTRATLSDPKFVHVDDGELKLTKIMDWYGRDFVDPAFRGSTRTLARYVEVYASDEVRAFIQEHEGDPAISFLDYDWSLNIR